MKKNRLLAFTLLGCSIALVPGCSTFPFKSSGPDIAARKVVPADGTGQQNQPPAPVASKSELVIPDHPSIDYWVRRYSDKNHKSFQTQLDRACNYVTPAEEIFARKGLPKELVYVALVESGFTPTARSHANAVGMYQIISKTGTRFGLEQNQYIDERRHPMKAAQAAADYLSFLYDTFKSWPLALAGYNAGENAVQGALDKSGLKDFWALLDNGYLPSETRDYVPKVLATVKIIRTPKQYGFHYNPQYYIKKHETVKVPGGVKLAWIEKKTGVSEESLLNCNPELCKPLTPPQCADYELCVPLGTGEDIRSQLANYSPEEVKAEKKSVAVAPVTSAPVASTSAATYKVKRGDTWASLAGKNKCSVAFLAALNNMKPSQPLQAGRALKLPKPLAKASAPASKPSATASAQVSKPAATASSPARGASKPVVAAKAKPAPSNVSAPAPAKKGAAPVAVAKAKPGKAAASAQAAARGKTAGAGPKSAHYVVRQGDTLSGIADRFRIPVKTLCSQNDLKPNQKLVPGASLTVYSTAQEPERVSKKKGN